MGCEFWILAMYGTHRRGKVCGRLTGGKDTEGRGWLGDCRDQADAEAWQKPVVVRLGGRKRRQEEWKMPKDTFNCADKEK